MNVIAGCGYYIKETHPPGLESRTVDDLAAELIHDITDGMDGTDLKAGVIGEIGVATCPMDPVERKVLEAAAIAQQETGCAIVAHSAPGDESPFEVLGVLAGAGADLTRVAEPSRRSVPHRHGQVPACGGDGRQPGPRHLGRELYYQGRRYQLPPDEVRVATVVSLIEAGLLDHIFPAQDICFKHELGTYGGHGYDHFIRRIVPRLKRSGVSSDEVDRMLRLNPARVLSGQVIA